MGFFNHRSSGRAFGQSGSLSTSRHADRGAEITLLLDIASDGVTGTLVSYSKNNPPRIIYSHREPLAQRHIQNITQLLADTLSAVRIVLLDVQKTTIHTTIKHINCFFSSPWHDSQTKIVTVSKTDAITVTERGIAAILEQERKAAIAAQNYAEPLEVVENSVIAIKLNGYETAVPYGKSANEIEITIFISLIGKDFLRKVKDTIAAVFAHVSPEFNTFSLAAFSVVRNLPGHPEDFLLVDIAGEVTDVSIVKKGVILELLTLPIGQNYFVRALSRRMQVPYQVALSLFQLHSQGKNDPATSERIARELKKESTKWQSVFHDALQNLSQESFVPKHVYLTAEEQLASFFSEMIAEQDFTQFSAEKTILEPIIIDEDYLRTTPYPVTSSTRKPVSSLLESIFIHTIKTKSKS